MLAEKIGGFVIFGLIQRCFEKVPSLRIHIRIIIINGLLGGYNVSVFASLNLRTIWGFPHPSNSTAATITMSCGFKLNRHSS